MKNIKDLLPLLLVLTICIFSEGCTPRLATSQRATDSDIEYLAEAEDPAIKAALGILKESPESAKGYLQLASVYIKKARETGDFSINKKAMGAVDRALEVEPQSVPARKLKASLLATFHRFPEARDISLDLQKDFPNDAFIYGVLTDANVELGNYDEALQAVQRMVDIKPNSSSYARVGHLRSLYGDHTGAIEMITMAARTADPRDREAQSWCLVTLGKEYFKAGEFDKAENVIDEALTISPWYGLAVVEKARNRAAKGDYQTAANYLSELHNHFPTPESLILSGDLNTLQQNATEANEQYREAENVARGLEGDFHRFALLWADHDTRLDEALQIAERDYATNKDIYAADILAWCLLKNNRLAEAKKMIAEAMRLDTKDARIVYHAGMIDKALGERRAAKKLLSSAIRLNPEFDLIQAQNARTALSELQ